MTKFKVGDIVKFKSDDSKNAKYFTSGLTNLEIKEVDRDSKQDLKIYESDKSTTWLVASEEVELVKGVKPDNMVRYMVYGTGCNNKSDLVKTETEMKVKMKKLTNDSDWTGRIIGYKMTPIFEGEQKTVLKAFKVDKVKKVVSKKKK